MTRPPDLPGRGYIMFLKRVSGIEIVKFRSTSISAQ
uniref:Uncharacterized protein n=1 Tax=Siphoviridae sp. ctAUQ2 TaxID=2826182 RepID=A0A8S5MYZ5_9CAUD|nr:MAG TPA: hypothetical protein [Siphoviridae sp. ctAUQ2]